MKVTLLTPEDLHWPLGSQETTPVYQCGAGTYPRDNKVDPYPAYAHDIGLVNSLATQCEKVFPLKDARVGIWILSHDFVDRTNGCTFEDSVYNKEDGSEWDEKINRYDGKVMRSYGQALSIILAAKRIPIMPAMTRYLVPHEYGHAVFDYVARKMGYPDTHQEKLKEEYMKLRGIEDYSKKYTGGKWHSSPGEIIANDFRVLFTGREMEFYPHDCSLPSWESPEGKWWIKAASAAGIHDLPGL